MHSLARCESLHAGKPFHLLAGGAGQYQHSVVEAVPTVQRLEKHDAYSMIGLNTA